MAELQERLQQNPARSLAILFRCGRFVRGLQKCIGEIVDVLIHDERGHRVIQRLLKGCRSSFAGSTAWYKFIVCE